MQRRPLYVGQRQSGLSAETIAISPAQAEQVETQATFQVNVMDPAGDLVRSYGFTWQGHRTEAWSPRVVERIGQIQPIAQRRVLAQALWLPLTTEMLARGWMLSDISDLVQRVTDLGLGREAQVVDYMQTNIRTSRKPRETEADQVNRIKGELLEWLEICDDV